VDRNATKLRNCILLFNVETEEVYINFFIFINQVSFAEKKDKTNGDQQQK